VATTTEPITTTEPTTTTPEVGSDEDPHLHLAHGGQADLRGTDGGTYNMLSTRRLSVNAKFRAQVFYLLTKSNEIAFDLPQENRTQHPFVHGTFMFETYATINTSANRLVHVKTVASNSSDANTVVTSAGSEGKHENLMYVLKSNETQLVDNIAITSNSGVTIIESPLWIIKSVVVHAASAHFINLRLYPTRLAAIWPVVPHGIVGQSFDNDEWAVDGATDVYNLTAGGKTTTKAQAEGAIEGVYSDYQMASSFATDFKFSRFGTTALNAREVSKLSGKKRKVQKKLFDLGNNVLPVAALET
jgi:hypothetical protein